MQFPLTKFDTLRHCVRRNVACEGTSAICGRGSRSSIGGRLPPKCSQYFDSNKGVRTTRSPRRVSLARYGARRVASSKKTNKAHFGATETVALGFSADGGGGRWPNNSIRAARGSPKLALALQGCIIPLRQSGAGPSAHTVGDKGQPKTELPHLFQNIISSINSCFLHPRISFPRRRHKSSKNFIPLSLLP